MIHDNEAMREFIIGSNGAGQRADRFLGKVAHDIPPGALQKAFRKKDVKRNGKPCRADERLLEGDVLRLYIVVPAAGNTGITVPQPVVPLLPPESIIYEDENIIVLHKPAGMPSQMDGSIYGIEDMARAYLQHKEKWVPGRDPGFIPSLCHRLDRNTEGLLLFAKTAEALRVLTEKIKQREVVKTYRCVVEGVPHPPSGEWRDFLWKDAKQKRVYAQKRPSPGAKEAVLRYRVLQSAGGKSLLEIELVTGRTHQIRVQCASRGYPILGDGKYGKGNDRKYPYQALCAVRIALLFRTGAGALKYLEGKVFEIDKKFADFY